MLNGCDKGSKQAGAKKDAPKAADSKKDEKKPAGDASAKAGDAKAEDNSPCGKYETGFCEAVGKTSPACSALGVMKDYLPKEACDAGLANVAFSKTRAETLQKVCKDLAERLCKDIGEKTDSCKMVREQLPKAPANRCKDMEKEYDKLVADLKKREEANKPLDAAKQAKIAAAPAPSFGPKDAKVVMVEFSDFQCPYCSRAADALNKIKKEYKDEVRVVFRQFPLSFHKDAHLASQAALAAGAQGKFWEFHDLLFKNQRALKRADLDKYAKELKLNMKKFKKALDSGTYKKQVDDDLALGKEVAVSGTPSMFLNGKRVRNATSFDAMKPEIDAALGKGGDKKKG